MKNLFYLFSTGLMCICLISCGSDDKADPAPSSLNQPTQIQLIDHGNHGDARDFYLSFKNLPVEENVADYNLIIAHSDSPTINLETAAALPGERMYTIAKTGFAYKGQPENTFLDTQGNAIQNNQSYKAYLYTRPSNQDQKGSLSNSISITLKNEVYYDVKTLSSSTGEALSYHPDGYLIIPSGQNRLLKVGTRNPSSQVFDAGLPWPLGGGFDLSTDTYYASYYSSGQIYAYKEDGSKNLVASGLLGPTGVAVENTHNIYVANYDGSYISKITPQGQNSVFATNQGLINGPDGLVFANDQLFSINFNDSRILKISDSGIATLFTTLPGTTTGYITHQDGFLYAASLSTRKIYKIDMSGNFEVIAGSGQSGEVNGPASLAKFTTPNGIAIAGDTIYVSDAESIRMIIRHN